MKVLVRNICKWVFYLTSVLKARNCNMPHMCCVHTLPIAVCAMCVLIAQNTWIAHVYSQISAHCFTTSPIGNARITLNYAIALLLSSMKPSSALHRPCIMRNGMPFSRNSYVPASCHCTYTAPYVIKILQSHSTGKAWFQKNLLRFEVLFIESAFYTVVALFLLTLCCTVYSAIWTKFCHWAVLIHYLQQIDTIDSLYNCI